MKIILVAFTVFALSVTLSLSTANEPIKSEVNLNSANIHVAHTDTMPDENYPVQKSEAEWKEILTDKEYRILRDRGTELPFVNEYNSNKRKGIYVCGACGQKLYSSEHKYESGSGWPSFWRPLADSLVGEREDNSWFMTRTEIVCSNCGSHLGYVFDDGPQPTGLRYCMNSLAMDFIPEDDVQETANN